MSTEILYNDVIKRLISVGKSEDYACLPTLFSTSEQNWHPHLADSHEQWLAIINSLKANEIVALIKAITIGEQIFSGWSAGSVSPVIRLFWRLHELDPAGSDAIAAWLLANSKNVYLPFGSMSTGGAMSVAEFMQHRAESYIRAQQHKEAEEERQRAVIETKRKREAEKATQNLFNAVRRNDEKAVEALLQKGADVKNADKGGVSILAFAEEQGNRKIIELLQKTYTDS